MKIVVNGCFGGFGLKEAVAEALGYDSCYEAPRTDPRLIKLIEQGVEVGDDCSELKVVEVPDEATDWRIDNHDGYEIVWYVVDGKIRKVYSDDFICY